MNREADFEEEHPMKRKTALAAFFVTSVMLALFGWGGMLVLIGYAMAVFGS
jgi:hypothetical protein